MLDLLRRKAQSPYLQATIVIIILVFIFFGVGSNTGNVQNSVATVNDEGISFQDYQREYDQTVNTLRDQFGGAIPTGLLDSINIKQQVLNKLVQGALLRQGALEAGLYVSDQELRNTIQEMEAFKSNGFFDAKWYEEVLASSRMSVSKFETELRYDLLSAKVLDHLSRFAVPSKSSIHDQFINTYQTTKFDYVELTADAYTDNVEVTDEKLNSYFEENKLNYQSEPKTKLNYLLFSFADTDTLPTDSAIGQMYQNTINQYALPEKRSARHILFRIGDVAETNAVQKAQAENVLARIRSGADFAEMAKEFSADGSASRGGDLGFFQREQMVKPFADAAFSMEEGAVSDIVETQFGYHIIKLEKIEPARIKPLEEVRDQIIAKIQQESKKTSSFELANSAYEKIILSGSLAKFVDNSKEQGITLPLTTTEFFSQLDPPEPLVTLPEIVNAGFTLKQGELSSIIETSQGYAIVFVVETLPPEQQDLASVKEKVEKDYIASEANNLAKIAAESLLNSLKASSDFAAEAQKISAELKTTPFISKNDFSAATLPAQIVQNIFTLSETNKYPEEISTADSTFYIIAFNDRQDPDETLFEEKKNELNEKFVRERNNDLLAAWLEHLRQDSKITTNEQLL
nr:SurA N-terminal domain-containing protein [Desulfobulbaceae bacterium]